MIYEFTLTTRQQQMADITRQVSQGVAQSGIQDGICVVYSPHTTAGITINENSDPDVVSDLLFALDQTYPDRPECQHVEGNSAAHLKAGVMGSSATLLIEKGQLVLGTWQAVYFCEFDGPRHRRFYVKVLGK